MFGRFFKDSKKSVDDGYNLKEDGFSESNEVGVYSFGNYRLIHKNAKELNRNAPQQTYSDTTASRTSNRQAFDVSDILKNPTAMACINKKATTIGQLDFDICMLDKDGHQLSLSSNPKDFPYKKRVQAQKVFNLLKHPNEVQTKTSFLRQISINLDLYGSAYIYFYRDNDDNILEFPSELHVLQNEYVQPEATNSKYPIYRNLSGSALAGFTSVGEKNTLKYFNISHLVSFPHQGISGINKLVSFPDLVHLDNGLYALACFVMDNSSKPDAIFTTEQDLTADRKQQISEDLSAKLKSLYNSNGNGVGETIILSNGGHLERMPLPSIQDADIRELKNQCMASICAALDVPKEIISIADSTFNNSKVAWNQFNSNTIYPIVTYLEEELNRQLFRGEHRDLYIKFNLEDLIKGDLIDQTNRQAALVKSSICTPNEIRKELGKAPIKGGDSLQMGNQNTMEDDTELNGSGQDTGGGGNISSIANMNKKNF